MDTVVDWGKLTKDELCALVKEQFKERSGHVYTEDRKLLKFDPGTCNVTDWVNSFRSLVPPKLGNDEKIQVLLEKLDPNSKIQIQFRIKPTTTVENCLDWLCEIHKGSQSFVQLQQEFYGIVQGRNQKFEDYYVELLSKAMDMKRLYEDRCVDFDNVVADKFVEGVYDVNLKRELRRCLKGLETIGV